MSNEIAGHNHVVTAESMEMTWHPEARLAVLRFAPNIALGGKEGALLVESLTGWIGAEGSVFGLLADTKGVRGADSEYRVKTRDFFKLHRRSAYVAVTNMGPVVRITAEMFRIGTGIQLKGFADEAGARAWLRQRGVGA
jgi:hypothetical protein